MQIARSIKKQQPLLKLGHIAGRLLQHAGGRDFNGSHALARMEKAKVRYGRKMVAYAEQLARAAGLTTVRLYTNQKFEENLRLYVSLGYEVEREEGLNGGVAIHMVKVVA